MLTLMISSRDDGTLLSVVVMLEEASNTLMGSVVCLTQSG